MLLGNETKGTIINILRYAVHDGPGIRTTVFLKGCPLRCLWCHNPESINSKIDLSYNLDKCIFCGECQSICSSKKNVHDIYTIKDGKSHKLVHDINYDNCDCCGECVNACTSGALYITGQHKTVSDVIAEVLKDQNYYQNSGGGLTVSGGEPMAQFEFTKALLMAAKSHNINTCLDTCGFASKDRYQAIIQYVDIFHYDIKESNPEKHKLYTGVKKDVIYNNLRFLNSQGAKIILRCPIIPGLNSRREHFREIADMANQLQNVMAIDIMPYHPWGISKRKYSALSGENAESDDEKRRIKSINRKLPLIPIVDQTKVQEWIVYLQGFTNVPVRNGNG
jgi:glycyl-radical enzyme activating protein